LYSQYASPGVMFAARHSMRGLCLLRVAHKPTPRSVTRTEVLTEKCEQKSLPLLAAPAAPTWPASLFPRGALCACCHARASPCLSANAALDCTNRACPPRPSRRPALPRVHASLAPAPAPKARGRAFRSALGTAYHQCRPSRRCPLYHALELRPHTPPLRAAFLLTALPSRATGSPAQRPLSVHRHFRAAACIPAPAGRRPSATPAVAAAPHRSGPRRFGAYPAWRSGEESVAAGSSMIPRRYPPDAFFSTPDR